MGSSGMRYKYPRRERRIKQSKGSIWGNESLREECIEVSALDDYGDGYIHRN